MNLSLRTPAAQQRKAMDGLITREKRRGVSVKDEQKRQTPTMWTSSLFTPKTKTWIHPVRPTHCVRPKPGRALRSVYNKNNRTAAYQALSLAPASSLQFLCTVAWHSYRLTYHNIDREKVKTLRGEELLFHQRYFLSM